jgi:dTDP-glucose 4,6-dehydratase
MGEYNPQTILVTGGAGFIGSNFIRYLLTKTDFDGRVVNLDKLTYAGNLMSLQDIAEVHEGSRYFFERADIADREAVARIFEKYQPDTVVHLAAESHVDRSIVGPAEFIQTNVVGTFTLLEGARAFWGDRQDVLFHHVSTDEVYGSLGGTGYFTEETPYDPRSPYSASKAGSDHLASAYSHTYGLPVTISNCSNNYGPYQFPEKLIPVMILNMLEGKPLPIYGKGENVRDWLYVEDHCTGIWATMHHGVRGESYNFGGNAERTNLQLVHELTAVVADQTDKGLDEILATITFVTDRPGHDLRYAIDATRSIKKLGWRPKKTLGAGLLETVRWYLDNPTWLHSVQILEYRYWTEQNYGKRDTARHDD